MSGFPASRPHPFSRCLLYPDYLLKASNLDVSVSMKRR
jgi:hypothetical protein